MSTSNPSDPEASKSDRLRVVYYGRPGAGALTQLEMFERWTKLTPWLFRRLSEPWAPPGESPYIRGFDVTCPDPTRGRRDDAVVNVSLRTLRLTVDREERLGLLRNADGLVYVVDSAADSQADVDAHRDDLDSLLAAVGHDPERFPTVFSWNKRDLPGALPVAELSHRLNPRGAPAVATCAVEGHGVRQCLDALLRLIAARRTSGES